MPFALPIRSEEHTSELQSHDNLVCRLLLEKNEKNPADLSYRVRAHYDRWPAVTCPPAALTRPTGGTEPVPVAGSRVTVSADVFFLMYARPPESSPFPPRAVLRT